MLDDLIYTNLFNYIMENKARIMILGKQIIVEEMSEGLPEGKLKDGVRGMWSRAIDNILGKVPDSFSKN